MLVNKSELNRTGREFVLKGIAGRSRWGQLPEVSISADHDLVISDGLRGRVLWRGVLVKADSIRDFYKIMGFHAPHYMANYDDLDYRLLDYIPNVLELPDAYVVCCVRDENSDPQAFNLTFLRDNIDIYLPIL